MRKLRVFFPRVEAGLGHITSCEAVAEAFTRKYGDKVDILNLNFYDDADKDKKQLKNYGEMLKRSVRKYTSTPAIGHFATFNCELWGTELSSWGALKFTVPGSNKQGVQYMEELSPDVIFSTHWATNYYAEQMKRKPFTIMYCPDAIMNKLFKYKADLTLVSMETGYIEAKQDTSFDSTNLKLVPFLIRCDAFDMKDTKEQCRERLGLPMDKFTIVLTDGGYGRGAMKKIIDRLIYEHIPATVIPICGKNEKLYEYFKTLKSTDEITFLPQGFTKDMFSFLKAADVFCGKSGSMIAEPTFFGVPSIITGTSTDIETNIANYYSDYVHCAIQEFHPKKVIKLLKQMVEDPSILLPYQQAAQSRHSHYGGEYTADLMWEEIVRRFPWVLHPELVDEEEEKNND